MRNSSKPAHLSICFLEILEGEANPGLLPNFLSLGRVGIYIRQMTTTSREYLVGNDGLLEAEPEQPEEPASR